MSHKVLKDWFFGIFFRGSLQRRGSLSTPLDTILGCDLPSSSPPRILTERLAIHCLDAISTGVASKVSRGVSLESGAGHDSRDRNRISSADRYE